MFRKFAALCASTFICLGAALGSDIYVPDDHATIQTAVNASLNGDTIIVRPGIYVEMIDFTGKAIIVKSEKGPLFTTIDGNQAGSVVVFQSGEGNDSILEGFTITNGTGTPSFFGPFGGGIYCNGGFFLNTSPTITNNIITGNKALYGGGIGCEYGSAARIIDNRIVSNQAEGVWCEDASPEIANNLISFNSADGIHGWSSHSDISGNVISGNSGSGIGGESVSFIIRNNSIRGNFDSGIYLYSWSQADITNNLIMSNSGSGIECVESGAITTNNTIFGNSGYGIELEYVSTVTAVNDILWENDEYNGYQIYINTYSTLSIGHSDVEGGATGAYIDPGSILNWNPGMIDVDPLFVDSTSGDLHLTRHSPCRNAGDSSAPNLADDDFEGDPRIVGDAVDMGADEIHPHLYQMGAVIPGDRIEIKVIGRPQDSVILVLGSGIQDPPQITAYGPLFLTPPLKQRFLGTINSNGFLARSLVVPRCCSSGEQYPLQALAGALLTNLLVLEIE